jgi:hypothetical protein
MVRRMSWERTTVTWPGDEPYSWLGTVAYRVREGRIVVLGEAGQLRSWAGDGLHGHNGRFARNVIEWLAGVGLREPEG